MRAVVQRVTDASVTVDGVVTGAIDGGLLVFAGVAAGDTMADVGAVADKIVGLRIFGDDAGKMNRSVVDTGGSVLLVSQFTLLADVRKGRRPSFTAAAPADRAEQLVAALGDSIAAHGIPVEHGRFGALMEVQLTNIGPVTIVIDVVDGTVR
jgi:D-tyrosyl-tRNA(Tyr) deacylase